MYTETDLVRVARRENNTKRSYLIVNPLQGKHMPVSPKIALQLFQQLAQKIAQQHAQESLLLIGFAETATAIGAAIAAELQCHYMQTTREAIDKVQYLYFSESHSHATEQKLVQDDVDAIIGSVQRIIFIEDEMTTGNTILKIIRLLQQRYPNQVQFAAASLLNGMEPEALQRYAQADIPLYYLQKTDHTPYAELAQSYRGDGKYHTLRPSDTASFSDVCTCHTYCNARRLVQSTDMQNACRVLWEQIHARYSFNPAQNILILGTEEFMYPPLFVAAKIEQLGCRVKFCATTRSPIAVSREPEYSLHERYELRSLYDAQRVTYVYDLAQYDAVFIITDAPQHIDSGADSLRMALQSQGNTQINLIRWCNEHAKQL